jgi:hypothetical protein
VKSLNKDSTLIDTRRTERGQWSVDHEIPLA